MQNKTPGWQFSDEHGSFSLKQPQNNNYLYFPLVNEAGIMSAVSPLLNGDIKCDQNSFLTLPVSVEDLHNTRSARNFWCFIEGFGAWSAAGNSAHQESQNFGPNSENVRLEAGFLWHKVSRTNESLGLWAEIINFIPCGQKRVELMQIELRNDGSQPLSISPTAAIPIFGRSADNLRDHRHVTSLLQRIDTHRHGVIVHPTLSFDERGHQPNHRHYTVLGCLADGQPPAGIFPEIESFIGEGGSLSWPAAVVENQAPVCQMNEKLQGYEALGGLRFADITLAPGQQQHYILILAIMDEGETADSLLQEYGSQKQFLYWLDKTKAYWQQRLSSLVFQTSDSNHNQWMRWITLQPILRRLFGNSFLPYHDYGRGGRGWRDLWQDTLVLLMMEPDGVPNLLHSYYGGVRLDGSNATIIGSQPGEFRADRNNIPRVWMDHGAWPLLTTQLYIHQSGDLPFLLRNQSYFKDAVIHRAQKLDPAWKPADGTRLRTEGGYIYQGSILEHLLVQHLTAFFNVGRNNNIRLEGADWNDGLDMAAEEGESVAFSALYAGNLEELSRLVKALARPGLEEIPLATELLPLLDTISGPVDYEKPKAKQDLLEKYFTNISHTVSGRQEPVSLADLARDLQTKADWLRGHIRTQEWIEDGQGGGWFNGYYDNDGLRVEGLQNGRAQMTLTGQVFALMAGVATEEQARQIVHAADNYLYDARVGGYRLNTDFGGLRLNLGRSFGFAYGHKENGAMFTHMAMMYANALYRRGLVHEGYKVLDDIYRQCLDFPTSRMYPGLPEYFNPRGRGMYPYLTGSASWFLLTMLNEVFGVRGHYGDLICAPRLLAGQFNAAGQAQVDTRFAGRRLQIIYHNPQRVEYGQYEIGEVKLNGQVQNGRIKNGSLHLSRQIIIGLESDRPHHLEIWLEPVDALPLDAQQELATQNQQ